MGSYGRKPGIVKGEKMVQRSHDQESVERLKRRYDAGQDWRYGYDPQGRLLQLNLSWLELVEVPQELWQLTNLQELHLYSNQLATLPAAIGQLTNLRVLDLSNNPLTTLPPEIRQLPHIQEHTWEEDGLIR